MIGATVLLVAACGADGDRAVGPGSSPPAAPAIEQLLGTAVIDADYPWHTPGNHTVAWLELSSDDWASPFPLWQIPFGWYEEDAFEEFVVEIPPQFESELTDGFVTGHHLRYQVGAGVQGFAPGYYSEPFSDDSFDVASVDFAGSELTEIRVTVQNVAFNQYYPSIWTIFVAQVRLEVWGFPSSP